MAIRMLVPWRSGSTEVPVTSLQTAMNHLFETFNRDFGLEPLTPWPTTGAMEAAFMPRVDVAEDDKEIHVTTELPGMDEKDIDISLTPDTLTIKGEKKAEHEERKKNYYRMERSYGSFQRSIPLPCEIEQDKAQATFKKGVLNVTLAKSSTKSQVRKIAVKPA